MHYLIYRGNWDKSVSLLGSLHAYTFTQTLTNVISDSSRLQCPLTSPLFSGGGGDDHDPPRRWHRFKSWLVTLTETGQRGRPSVCTADCVLRPPRGHSALSSPSSTASLPRVASGRPPSPWNSSSISCSPAVPARDAHRAAPSLRPRERSSRA